MNNQTLTAREFIKSQQIPLIEDWMVTYEDTIVRLLEDYLTQQGQKEAFRDAFEAGTNWGLLLERLAPNFETWYEKYLNKELQDPKKCGHKNITSEDGCDECLDCGTRNY